MKYTFEIKLKAVKAIKKGIVIKEPNNEISRKWRDIIRYWEKIYDIHGEEGFRSAVQGDYYGISYRLISADYLNCCPIKIR